MSYVITGLPVDQFRYLFALSDDALAERHIVRVTADAALGFPCRILLEDALPGDSLLLMNHEYQSAQTPYRGRHAIFVNEAAKATRSSVDEVPPMLRLRPFIALRAYDGAGMMRAAELVSGEAVGSGAQKLLSDPKVAYLHAHFAARGCFAARIDRS